MNGYHCDSTQGRFDKPQVIDGNVNQARYISANTPESLLFCFMKLGML